MGLDTKIYWLTERQLQRDFDFDFEVPRDSAPRMTALTRTKTEIVNNRYVLSSESAPQVKKPSSVWQQ
jgi:hypothetical protein